MATGGEIRGAGWSGAYLLASRLSTLAAVPILVDQLGVDLYAVWVLGTTFIFSQGLLDFGCAAAVVRFAAVGKADESRGVVLSVLARGGLFYFILSLASVALWLAAPSLVDSLTYIDRSEADGAVTLLRYIAVAFAATNLTLLVSATLQGLGRVDASYRAKTAGAALYLPLLLIGLEVLDAPQAAGISVLGMYALELVLAGVVLVRELARTREGAGAPPPIREMFRVGVRWQVSSWADFATFQLPRIITAVSGSSQSALVVDLALRYGQAITTPLFAFYPVVLPIATTTWSKEGREGVGRLLQRYVDRAATVVLVAAALAIPLAAATIEVWAGVSLTTGEAAAAMAIALGMVAYACTGVFSSALLAVDALGDVVRYKGAQLTLAVALLFAASSLGITAVGIALALALAIPATWFIGRAAGLLNVSLGSVLGVARWASAVLAALAACALAAHGHVDAWVLLAAGCGITVSLALLARDRLLAMVRPLPAARQ